LLIVEIWPVESEMAEIAHEKISGASGIKKQNRQTEDYRAKKGVDERRLENKVILFLKSDSIDDFLRR